MLNAKELYGTWRLITYEHLLDSGERIFPLGQDALGQLMYSDDGRMAASMMRAGRPRGSRGGPFDGTDEELAAAARSYFSYAGTYELRDDRVLHHVEISLIPRWTGSTQERLVSWQDARLVLSTPHFVSAAVGQVGRLVWERMSP